MESAELHKIFELLNNLEKRKMRFSLFRRRPDTITVVCVLVGLRLEIDVFEDGRLEYSVFTGDEGVESFEEEMWRLVDEYS